VLAALMLARVAFDTSRKPSPPRWITWAHPG
jgi:hypothetical protein